MHVRVSTLLHVQWSPISRQPFLFVQTTALRITSIRELSLLPQQYVYSKLTQDYNISSSSNLRFFMMPSKLLIKKLSEFATIPSKGSKLAAGYDIYAAHDSLVKARGKNMVPTDLQIQLPPNCYGRIAPRSGLAWKHSIDVGAGVIDEDYRGSVNVILFNFSDNDFEIKRGDRIAQLICERIEHTDIEEVKDLTDTERGANGFGSTGV